MGSPVILSPMRPDGDVPANKALPAVTICPLMGKHKYWIAITITALIAALVLATHLRIQGAGTARVVRSANDLRILGVPVGWAARYGTAACVVPRTGGRASFSDSGVVTDSAERQFPAQIRFDYVPPKKLPADWPDGDWCVSLRQRVFETAARWVAAAPPDRLIADKRESGREAEAVLRRKLESAGIQVSNLSVRFIVPELLSSALSVPEIATKAMDARPVIFLGLDGADWTLLDGYMAAGDMPNLARLVREGRSGILQTQTPPLSPLLWNTMMTGVSPLEHRILDFTRFHPDTGVKEPITADERREPAIWNMATFGGKSVAVFGLWATYPAEAVRGLIVSDRFFTFLFTEETPPAGVVFPPSRDGWARQIRKNAEAGIGYEAVRQYLPWLTESEFASHSGSKDAYAHPVSALHRILMETELYHRLATDYLRSKVPDLSVIYFQSTDSIGHVFAPYNPPRQPHISEQDFNRYKDVARLFFRNFDRLLGEYVAMALQKQAVLMLASDHGFRWLEGRPTELSSFATATAAKWHRNEGIYLIWGERIAPGRSARGDIQQVCATLLKLAGLPHARGAAREPLGGLPGSTTAVDYRQHYRAVPPPAASGAEAVSEEIAKLRALGYIGATEPTATSSRGSTRTAGSHNNEALILRHQKKTTEAVAALERALALDPTLASAAWNLSDMLWAQKRELDRSDALLVQAFANGLPEAIELLVGRSIGYQRSGYADRSLHLLESAVAVKPDDTELRLFRGRYRIDRGECAGALEDFRVAQQLNPRNPIAFASAGIAEVCLGNPAGALAYFRQALQIDPNQPRIRAYIESLQ